MRVPLTIGDFLERAALVYRDRVAVVDEPGTPGSLGSLTYAEVHRRARAMAAALDRMGVGQGERVAIVSPNAARFLISFFGVSGFGRVLVPINFRLNADEVALHRRALGRVGAARRPRARRGARRRHRQAPHRPRRRAGRRAVRRRRRRAEPQRWEPDEDATASINYTSGTTARPKGVQLTHRNCWLNAVTFGWHTGVSDRDVYLHTLPMFHCNGWGMPYALTGDGRAAGRAAQGRRRGDPAPHRRARASRCCAARPRSSPRSSTRPRRGSGEAVPGEGRAHGRRRRAAAVEGHRAGRDASSAGSSSRSTASPRRRRC